LTVWPASAGVTSGAFYSNFSNKEALLEEVIATCVGEPFIDTESGSLAERQDRLRKWLAMYISASHRADPSSGCVMPTLSADVARANPEIRATYQRKMLELVRKMSNLLDGKEPDRKTRAWSIIAMMVGALTIARAMPDGRSGRSGPRFGVCKPRSLLSIQNKFREALVPAPNAARLAASRT